MSASGLSAWFDMTSYSAGVWSEKSGSGATATIGGTGLTTVSQSAGSNGASSSFTYLSGASTASVRFNMANISGYQLTVCTVSRYTGGPNARIFQSTSSTANWAHGHWNGGAGLILAGTGSWVVGTGTAGVGTVPLTNWVVMCSAASSPTAYTALVNGYSNYTNAGVTITTPFMSSGTIGINYGGTTTEYSAFGVAELMVWNRTLSSVELYQTSNILVNKYGLTTLALAPPPPPAATPPHDYPLDSVTALPAATALFALNRLTAPYTGPTVRLCKADGSLGADFYGTHMLGTLQTLAGLTVPLWLATVGSPAVASVCAWYAPAHVVVRCGSAKHPESSSRTVIWLPL